MKRFSFDKGPSAARLMSFIFFEVICILIAKVFSSYYDAGKVRITWTLRALIIHFYDRPVILLFACYSPPARS